MQTEIFEMVTTNWPLILPVTIAETDKRDTGALEVTSDLHVINSEVILRTHLKGTLTVRKLYAFLVERTGS